MINKFLQGIWDMFVWIYETMIKPVYESIRSLVEGLINGVTSAINAIVDSFTTLSNSGGIEIPKGGGSAKAVTISSNTWVVMECDSWITYEYSQSGTDKTLIVSASALPADTEYREGTVRINIVRDDGRISEIEKNCHSRRKTKRFHGMVR